MFRMLYKSFELISLIKGYMTWFKAGSWDPGQDSRVCLSSFYSCYGHIQAKRDLFNRVPGS